MYIQPSQEELNEAHKALALLKRKNANNQNKNITPRAITNNNPSRLNQNFNTDNQYLNNGIKSNQYRGYNNINNMVYNNNNNNYAEFETENIRTKPMQVRKPITTKNQYLNDKNYGMDNLNQYNNNLNGLNMNYNNSNLYTNNYNLNNNKNYNNNNYNNNNYNNYNNYNKNNNYSNTHSNNNYSNNQYKQINYSNPKTFNPISNNNPHNNKYSNNNPNSNFQYNVKGEYEDNRPIHDGGAIQGDNPEKGESTYPCPHCGRSFVQRVLDKHVNICQKVFQNKRKTFNTQKQRMTDIEQVSLMKQGKMEEKRNPMLNNKYKSSVPKWKLQSEEFRKIARGDFGTGNKGKGGNIGGGGGYTPSVITDSYIPCKFCNRKYNEEAYNKHLAGCERRYKDAQLKNKFSKKGTSNNNLNRIGGYNNKKPIVYGAYGRK